MMVSIERRAALDQAEHYAQAINDFLYMEPQEGGIVYVHFGSDDDEHVMAFDGSGPVRWTDEGWQHIDVADQVTSLLYRIGQDCERIRDWIKRETANGCETGAAEDKGFLLYAELVAGELRKIMEGGADHDLPGVQ